MKKIALILLAAASLVGTASIASAQWYGGNPGPYYGDQYRGRYYDDGYTDSEAMDITNGDVIAETLANMMYTATSARLISHAKTVSANRIADTEFISSRPPKLAASLILPFGFVG